MMAFTATQIKAIQTKLKSLGYYKGVVDGIFGSYTLAAVKLYQKAKGLAVDGVVGPVTAKALGLTSVLFPTVTPTPVAVDGSRIFHKPCMESTAGHKLGWTKS